MIADLGQALERTHALLPSLRERAARAEAERSVSAETIAALSEAELFRLNAPRAFGGSELGFAAHVRVTAALASACGSTGWLYGVFAGHNWIVGLLEQAAQVEVLADPTMLASSMFRLAAKASPEAGGYRITGGEGRFCSGILHAQWLLAGCAVDLGDGPPELRFFLIPRDAVEVVDDWFTSGMRGTGSCSIRVADAFVPQYRTVALSDLAGGTAPGARLYGRSPRFAAPFGLAAPMALIGVPLGLAEAALEAYTSPLAKTLGAAPLAQAGEQGAVFERMARAAAEVDAARALVLADAERLDTAAHPGAIEALEAARIQRNLAHAAQTCRSAVNSLFEAAGGGGIYDRSPLQRIWRDANAASAHMAFGWDAAATKFARAYLGLPPSAFATR